MVTYDIANIKDIDIKNLISHNIIQNTPSTTIGLSCKLKEYNDNKYTVIKYIKKELTNEKIKTIGLFRSIISKNGKILVFAPPKSLKYEDFIKDYSLKDCVIEEYIEGTMINLFFDNEWEISTRSNVGGNYKFFNRNNDFTFRRMFLEACNKTGLEFDSLNKDFCYSFVLQHPKNRIVIPFDEPKLYLVSCYKIDNETLKVHYINPSEQSTCVSFPQRYSFDSFENIEKYYTINPQSHYQVGLMIHHIPSGNRTKVRNIQYEFVRRLRENESNDLYRYLELRRNRRVTKYLEYFTEEIELFNYYRKNVEKLTSELYNCYVEIYIKKYKNINDLNSEMRFHVDKLHNYYLNVLRIRKQMITKKNVIYYINNMSSHKLYITLITNYSELKLETPTSIFL